MLVEDSQLYKFIFDSGLVSREDLDSAKKEAEEKDKKIGNRRQSLKNSTGQDQLYMIGDHSTCIANKKRMQPNRVPS